MWEYAVAGPVLTMADLATAGTRWPAKAADRKPRYGVGNLGQGTDATEGTLDLGG